MYFVFIAKGMEGALLVEKRKIPAKEAGEAKKELGGGMIYRGQCKWEDGQIVFEMTKEPPGTLAALLKKTIKREAGVTMDVLTRFSKEITQEDEDEDEKLEPPQRTPPPMLSQWEGLTHRLNLLAGAIKAASSGPNAELVKAFLSAFNEHKHKNEFGPASKALNELEDGFKKMNAPVSVVDLKGFRLVWDTTRNHIDTELQATEKKLLDYPSARRPRRRSSTRSWRT